MDLRYHFPTDYNEILNRLHQYDPSDYGASRNYLNGTVTFLSPYISRGILSTKRVLSSLIDRGFEPNKIEKLIQELAWRDYWQQVWLSKGNEIFYDLKHKQQPIRSNEIPLAVAKGQTGITAIDAGIRALKSDGYMHNHLRMYVASVCCNVAYSHWKQSSQWMYFYLLDADLASNVLSWQWVAGSNANKKYVANQTNINQFCGTTDQYTFLDVDYSELEMLRQPKILAETTPFNFKTSIPKTSKAIIQQNISTYIYNFYNIDVEWDKGINANRVLLLEPSVFEQFPVAEHSILFAINLAKNIKGIQIVVAEFDDFVKMYQITDIHFKEHPLNKHYVGTEHQRDWLTDVTGYFSSFFKFWNKAKKNLL